ncbi:MAG TPA: molybdopterin-dependent oxidoreductase [Blastocatellia bacterium]|nr:molybdopterin-dependent oxidoreductase [Blastocatellia bacterium]
MDMSILNIENKPAQTVGPEEVRLQAALVASILTLVAAFAARFLFRGILVPELAADYIFSVLPISLIEFGVSLLGPFAKQLGFIGCVVLYLAALTTAAELFLRLSKKRIALQFVALAAAAWGLTAFAFFPAIGAGFGGKFARGGTVSALASTLVNYSIYALSLYLLARFYSEGPGIDETAARAGVAMRAINKARATLIPRRSLIKWAGYSVIGVACYDIARALITPILQAGAGRVRKGTGRFPDIDGLALEITPTSDFYEVSKNPSDPEVDEQRWRLEIRGLVESPISFTYDEIKNLPYVDQYATLECISNEVGGSLIGNALWRGVQLKYILNSARLKPGVTKIVLRAIDGYSDSIPIDRALQDGTILAYLINQAPLPQSHGFPVRLIVPGIYGMKNVKWITGIDAVDYDFKGYWQRRGWDDRAEYKTMSRIDAPTNPVRGVPTIAGIAFAGDRGISKVELSADGGGTWETAEIKAPLSPYTWVLWHGEFASSGAGTSQVVVRATDGKGTLQTSARASPIPDGASGYDRRSLNQL